MQPEDWRNPGDPDRLFSRSPWESLALAAIIVAAFVLGLLVYCNAPEMREPAPPPGQGQGLRRRQHEGRFRRSARRKCV